MDFSKQKKKKTLKNRFENNNTDKKLKRLNIINTILFRQIRKLSL